MAFHCFSSGWCQNLLFLKQTLSTAGRVRLELCWRATSSKFCYGHFQTSDQHPCACQGPWEISR